MLKNKRVRQNFVVYQFIINIRKTSVNFLLPRLIIIAFRNFSQLFNTLDDPEVGPEDMRLIIDIKHRFGKNRLSKNRRLKHYINSFILYT